MRGVDLRTVGSRNVGATNAFRSLGPTWGVVVFVLDAAKGALAASAPALLASVLGLRPQGNALFLATILGGLAAIAGHVFSPWLGFKGGRGVATSLGVFLAIMALPTLVAFGLWTALVALSRRVSVGSIGAAIVYPILVCLERRHDPNQIPLMVAAGLVAVLVIVRHSANIKRLLAGTEPPLHGPKTGAGS